MSLKQISTLDDVINHGITSDAIGVFHGACTKGLVRDVIGLNGKVNKVLKPVNELQTQNHTINLNVSYNTICANPLNYQHMIIDTIDAFVVQQMVQYATLNTQPSIRIPSLNPVFKVAIVKAIDAMISKLCEVTQTTYSPFIVVAEDIAIEFKDLMSLTDCSPQSSTNFKGSCRPLGVYSNTVVYTGFNISNKIIIGIKGKHSNSAGFGLVFEDQFIISDNNNAVLQFTTVTDNNSLNYYNIINVGAE